MMHKLSIIAAIGANNELGKNNQLLWHISNDLKRFKSLTSGHTVIMGRKTFQSLKNGALPNRRNIVLTNNLHFNHADIEIAHSVDEVLVLIDPDTESFILGGGDIYKLFLPFVQRLYLTIIDQNYDADTFFPEFDREGWKEIEHINISDDKQAGINYSFVTFERR